MRLLREWEEESSDGEAEQDVSHEQPEVMMPCVDPVDVSVWATCRLYHVVLLLVCSLHYVTHVNSCSFQVGRYVDKEQIEVFQLPLSLFPSDSESFRHGIYLGSGLVVHANHVKGDDLIRQALWEAGLWRDIRRGIVSPDPVHAVRRPATSEELRALHDGKSFLSWAKIQWILEEVKSLLRTCQDANDCGLLVFGGVRDMALWERATPPGCPVAFVEENPLVVEASREIAAERGLRVEIHHSDFGGSSFKEWNKRPIRKYAPLLIQGIPSPLQDHMWDVVVVDGPSALVHGRIKSIFWANQVISPDGVAFVDDIAGPKLKLPIERVYADYYFSPGPMEIFTDDSETGSTMGKYMLVR